MINLIIIEFNPLLTYTNNSLIMKLHILNIKPEGCNENNQHEYIPIIPTERIQFHIGWYNSLPGWIQQSLKKVFPDFKLSLFELPHIEILKNDIFWKFYKWYYHIYDIYNYKDLVYPTYFIFLNEDHIKELNNLCILAISGTRKPNLDEDCTFLKSLFFGMKTILNLHSNVGLFVKTSHKSANNDCILFPAMSLDDIFKNIIYSLDVFAGLSETNYIILKPWNDKITKNTEFKAFVENKKLIAISQTCASALDEMPFISGLVEKLNELIAKIPYNDAILNIDYQNTYVLTLIKIAPGSRWHKSDSGLFTWHELEDIKKENKDFVPVKIYIK